MRNLAALCFITVSFFLPTLAQSSGLSSNTATSGEADNRPANTQNSPALSQSQKVILDPDAKASGSKYEKKDSPARIPRFETPPVIDGKLDDAIWQTAAVFGDFLQIQPGDNVAPTAPTEVMIGYDAKNLYIAFRVKQERDKLRATVSRRDNLGGDDFVGVYIDTFNDKRQAYFVFLNPYGIQTDGTFTEGRGEDSSVDILMESKGVLTEDGYTVEAAIPFKSLRYEAGANKQWGIQLFRRIRYNNNELDSWMPSNRNISGSLNQAGHIVGLDGIETTHQLEINPSVTLSESGRRTRYAFDNNPGGRYVNERLTGELGFTAKFGLTPTTTLDFAFNPDFAQVEADAPVVTANQRFPIFFAEKRPFFLERIDIFQTPMDVVTTRSIVDPDVALKLTGRRGKNTFGLLYASDNAPGNYSKDERQDLFVCQQKRLFTKNLDCGDIERFMDKNADIGIVRLKHDVGTQSNVGFFATTYNFPERHNHTAGFDGRIRFSPKVVGEFQVVGTNSRRNFYDPDQDKSLYRTGNGFGYSAWVERAGKNLYMNYMATGRSRDYRADVGFTQRTDTNYLGSFVQYKTDQDSKKLVIFKRIQNSTNVNYDWRGRTQTFYSNTQGMLALQRQTFVGGGVQYGYERVFEHEFGANRTATRQGAFFGNNSERSAYNQDYYVFIESTPNKQFYTNVVLDYIRGQLDYDFGAGTDYPRVSPAALLLGQNAPFDPGPGTQWVLDSQFRYQPTTAFQTQLNYKKTRLVRNDTHLTAFDDNLFSSRSTYQFSRNTFARLRLDYSTLNKHVRPQLVVGWTPHPGTALYIGYNDDVSYNGYNPYTGKLEPGLQGNGRTFFIKASYLFKKSF